MEKKYWHFNFAAEGLTFEQAEKLMDIILAVVQLAGGSVGGGFTDIEEKCEEEATHA